MRIWWNSSELKREEEIFFQKREGRGYLRITAGIGVKEMENIKKEFGGEDYLVNECLLNHLLFSVQHNYPFLFYETFSNVNMAH